MDQRKKTLCYTHDTGELDLPVTGGGTNAVVPFGTVDGFGIGGVGGFELDLEGDDMLGGGLDEEDVEIVAEENTLEFGVESVGGIKGVAVAAAEAAKLPKCCG